jgi:hypothetical protein
MGLPRRHMSQASTALRAERIGTGTVTRFLAIHRAEFCRPYFTVVSDVPGEIRFGTGAVACHARRLIRRGARCNVADAPVHAHNFSTGADIHLIFALEANESSRTFAVLKVLVESFVNQMSVNAKLAQVAYILGSFATDPSIEALQLALAISYLLVLKLAHWADKAVRTVASQGGTSSTCPSVGAKGVSIGIVFRTKGRGLVIAVASSIHATYSCRTVAIFGCYSL